MDVEVEPGIYVLAVSGGVDSVVLLNLLRAKYLKDKVSKHQFIIAHFDHGIRPDSKVDRLFVQGLAEKYDLPFVFDNGELGKDSSEALAREARYNFLNRVKVAAKAKAIITAHHQDDMLETAVINLLRGTGRRGLTALKSGSSIIRPMLHLSKNDILSYANGNHLEWHEDSTNLDTKYLRNHVRHNLLPKFSARERRQFLEHIENLKLLNDNIDEAMANHLHIHPAANILDRNWFNELPENVAKETMISWLKLRGVEKIDSKKIDILLLAARNLDPGKQVDIDKEHILRISRERLALLRSER